MEIPAEFHDLLSSKAIAMVGTIGRRGEPQVTPLWFLWDGDRVRISLVEGRQKLRNLQRNPAISLVVVDPAQPTYYVELRGRVSMTPDVGRAVDTQLSWKYDGRDPGEDRPGAVRVVVRMEVEKATGYGA